MKISKTTINAKADSFQFFTITLIYITKYSEHFRYFQILSALFSGNYLLKVSEINHN
jgi:hypothetical protein